MCCSSCGKLSEIECAALGFSYVRSKPRNGWLAKMGSSQHSKRSDSKRHTVQVWWGIFVEDLTVFIFLRAVINIPTQTPIISPWLLFCEMIISQLELGPHWFVEWTIASFLALTRPNKTPALQARKVLVPWKLPVRVRRAFQHAKEPNSNKGLENQPRSQCPLSSFPFLEERRP